MSSERLTAPKAANRLSKIMAIYSQAHGLDRFPVDVVKLALQAHEVFHWSDAITEVKGARIAGFEGSLHCADNKTRWMLLYNDSLSSKGRIRFTQAHELGHYILHRFGRESMSCTEADMLDWSKDEENLEGQADQFASYLLMPFDDFREQSRGEVSFDMFINCRNRYGVSITAAILRWLDCTTEKAVFVYSTDGFMNWASSSEYAMKAGAFFKTRGLVVPIPGGSVAADQAIEQERGGRNVSASVWFPHAERGMEIREMKLVDEGRGAVLTLLHLPTTATVWPPWTENR